MQMATFTKSGDNVRPSIQIYLMYRDKRMRLITISFSDRVDL